MNKDIFNKKSPIDESFSYINGSFSGPEIDYSSDPLVAYRWENPQPDDDVQIFVQKPEKVWSDHPASFHGLESLTGDTPAVTINGTGTIVVDFGREYAGWFEIDSPDCPDGLKMSISEYNEPAQLNNDGSGKVYDKTIVPNQIGTTYRAEFASEPTLRFEGVRFGFIHVNTCDKPWHITGIRLVAQVKPANYDGCFYSNDEMLNKIWYMAAYSVKVCNVKETTFPILMDRSDRFLWNGLDFHIYNKTNMIAFNQYAFVRKQIRDIFVDGNEAHRGKPVDTGIPGFRLYDVLSLCNFYAYTGDVELVDACTAEACRRLDDGYKQYYGYTNGFMGWDERLGGFEAVTKDNLLNYKMLAIHAWSAFARMMAHRQNTALQDKYNAYADEKIAELRRDKTWYQEMGVHARAEAVQAGFCTGEELAGIYCGELDDRLGRVSNSPANTGLIVTALGKMGKYDNAINTILDQWGALIAYGATTTAEMFHPSAAKVLGKNDPPVNGQCGWTSLCHPWGSSPVNYINETVLGIVPTAPGFDTVDILPHLGSTLSVVRGTTPTLKGNIDVDFNLNTGACRITIPAGVVARIGIPKAGRSIESVRFGQQVVWDGSYHSAAGIGGACADEHFVYFTQVTEGQYAFEVVYRGEAPAYIEETASFPATFVKEDMDTQGNWGGVYGSEGYILFNYNGGGQDKCQLPEYVTSVTCNRYGHILWETDTDDIRALAPDHTNTGLRTAAGIYTQRDPEATFQTMYTDIIINETKEYTLALYFIDWDDQNRRIAVELIDYDSFKQAAPVQVVNGYGKGKYLIYKYNQSVRIRVDTIKKPNSTLSGIFFGSC